MTQRKLVLVEIAASAVARYYWARKWMMYPMVGLPGWILMWFWLRSQTAERLRKDGWWKTEVCKWWLSWALSIALFFPEFLTAKWFMISSWAWTKGDFWKVDK